VCHDAETDTRIQALADFAPALRPRRVVI